MRLGARALAIKARSQGIGVEIESGGQGDMLDASHVLVSFGRKADLDQLDIARARLKPGVNSSRTIALVGTAAGRDDWGAARAEGRAALEALLGMRRAAASPLAPRLVETEPALAEIGPLALPRRKAPAEDMILRENLAENDRAACMGNEGGMVKVSLDGKGQIRRASVVGPAAADLAGVLALAMARKVGLTDFADLPLPHPSLFEVFSRLSENYLAAPGVLKKRPGKGTLRRLLGL